MGDRLMSAVGASPWQTGLAVAVEVGLPAAGFAALCGWRGWSRAPR